MSLANQTTVSRNAFIIACTVAAILFLVLLICILKPLKPPAQPGAAAGLDEAITRYKSTTAVALISGDAQFTLLAPNGALIEPCSRGPGTEIPAECFLKEIDELTHDNTLSVTRIRKSDCVYVKDGSGHIRYTYHIGYPTAIPCHHKQGLTGPHAPN